MNKHFLSKSPIINNQKNELVVYNFHSILNQNRFFIFLNPLSNNVFLKKNQLSVFNFFSISELFINANWLERELIEMHGIFLIGKKDIRNLMLQYGDTSSPLKKSFPSIGTREIFYDSSSDLLIQNPVSIQF